ncbi:hypothetical protein EKE94_00965 [Mesobaculum littorinae]|uniref:Secreted protein n=1 Tax=Mesobaculum littorinae TaxID=2486419 RepID=A0A438AKV7_9RHOB|nr:hypothetical protein [Mesobaculum littorinae]RVV99300.1 hypothetical protein EKE94_00965 [Mesobaculum littorinae]
MKILMALALATAPATCNLATPQEEEPTGPQRLTDISPAAMAALPEGMDPTFLIRDGNGCYGIAVEASDPPRGIQLIDDAGQPVCDA